MLIPQVTICARLMNGAAGDSTLPAYMVPVLRQHLGAKLDRTAPGEGLEVRPFPDHQPNFREVADLATEERHWRSIYRTAFDAAHPNGLRDAVSKILREDAERAARVAARAVHVDIVHQSFTDAGIPAPVALSAQRAGYATVSALPEDFVDLASIQGVDSTMATKLSTARAEAHASAKTAVPAQPAAKK